jgi:hypothetical protein
MRSASLYSRSRRSRLRRRDVLGITRSRMEAGRHEALLDRAREVCILPPVVFRLVRRWCGQARDRQCEFVTRRTRCCCSSWARRWGRRTSTYAALPLGPIPVPGLAELQRVTQLFLLVVVNYATRWRGGGGGGGLAGTGTPERVVALEGWRRGCRRGRCVLGRLPFRQVKVRVPLGLGGGCPLRCEQVLVQLRSDSSNADSCSPSRRRRRRPS